MFRALITSSEERGVAVDGCGTIDSNPERTKIEVEPLDCTFAEFQAALEAADTEHQFVFSEGGRIHDIGGFRGPLERGLILCIDDKVISVLSALSLEAIQQELRQRREQAIDDFTVWLSRQPGYEGPAL